MPFDAGPRDQPQDPHPAHSALDEPIDWIDWGMRIVVFGGLLVLYIWWVWSLLRPIASSIISLLQL